MRFSAFLLSSALFLAACGGPDPQHTACFGSQSSWVFQSGSLVERDSDAQYRRKVSGCTEVLAGLKPNRPYQQANTLARRAKAYALLGEFDNASSDIEAIRNIVSQEGIADKQNYIRGLALTLDAIEAMALYENGKAAEGREKFASLVAEYPYVEPLHGLALSYALKHDDMARAADLSLLPGKLTSSSNFGEFAGKLYEAAEKPEMARQVYESDPDSINGWIRRGHMDLRAGNKDAARTALEEARRLADAPLPERKAIGFAALRSAGVNLDKYRRDLEKKRVAVLDAAVRFADTEDASAVSDVLQMSTSLAHFEVLSTLQYMRSVRPDLIPSTLPTEPARPSAVSAEALEKMRRTSMRLMPQILPKKILFGGGKSGYSSSVWMLKSSGFSDDALDNGNHQISFEGSTATERPFMVEMMLLRAAEISQKKGHAGFRVRELNHYNKVMTMNGSPFGDTVGLVSKMQVEFVDDLGEADRWQAFSAQELISDLGPVYIQ